jgi:hypothetical protein
MASLLRLTTPLAAICMLFAVSCESPVDDDLIESLGPEVEGVDQGEFHRYGQPCLACHGGYGDGPEFSVAGTVFVRPDGDTPAQNARVTISDAIGQKIELVSNCAGNFYVAREAFDPVFPLRAEVVCVERDGVERRNVMGTRIHREGGCAGCHARGEATESSPGQVYCVNFDADPSRYARDANCRGGPAPQ